MRRLDSEIESFKRREEAAAHAGPRFFDSHMENGLPSRLIVPIFWATVAQRMKRQTK